MLVTRRFTTHLAVRSTPVAATLVVGPPPLRLQLLQLLEDGGAAARPDECGAAAAVAALLRAGAGVHAKNKAGQTPLHCVRTARAARLLLKHGALVHARDRRGGTPLLAAMEGHASKATVRALVRAGASIVSVNSDVHSVLSRCLPNGYIEHGATPACFVRSLTLTPSPGASLMATLSTARYPPASSGLPP